MLGSDLVFINLASCFYFSRSVEASTENMRCVLADAFKLIRFVELSPEEFEQGPGSEELLTVHVCLHVCRPYHTLVGEGRLSPLARARRLPLARRPEARHDVPELCRRA